MFFSQSQFDIRFEWGVQGLHAIDADVVIIVDILSFSTCVDIAVGNSAIVYPQGYDTPARQFPHEYIMASRQRSRTVYSLSPSSLLNIPAHTHLILPSPNGSAISTAAAGRLHVMAGCLRNRTAVAQHAERTGQSIAVIAAGERWPDRTLRVALEDMIGAGAVISALSGSRSPEAQAAANIFALEQRTLGKVIRNCSSGRELIERGFPEDIALAAQLDCSTTVPVLIDGAYGKAE